VARDILPANDAAASLSEIRRAGHTTCADALWQLESPSLVS